MQYRRHLRGGVKDKITNVGVEAGVIDLASALVVVLRNAHYRPTSIHVCGTDFEVTVQVIKSRKFG